MVDANVLFLLDNNTVYTSLCFVEERGNLWQQMKEHHIRVANLLVFNVVVEYFSRFGAEPPPLKRALRSIHIHRKVILCWPHSMKEIVKLALQPTLLLIELRWVFSPFIQMFFKLRSFDLRPNPKKNMGYGTLELTITSPYVHFRVESNTFTMGNPMPESTLSPSQGLWI